MSAQHPAPGNPDTPTPPPHKQGAGRPESRLSGMMRFFRGPEGMLILMVAAMSVSLNGWFTLLNNFVVERANFDGQQIGFLQSIREIPGFLSFCAILLLPFIKEQNLAILSLVLLGLGTAITGYFPYEYGLYVTTFLMSLGFHYYETMNQSLTLQLIDKGHAPVHMSYQLVASSVGTLAVFLVIMLTFDTVLLQRAVQLLGLPPGNYGLSLGYEPLYLGAGLFTLGIAVMCKLAYPHFPGRTVQTRKLLLRRRYWLYYALTFMGGARRQIFMVFAGFLMVEKFGFDVPTVTLLYMVNLIANILIAPTVGRLIRRLGERRALIIEYIGLIAVFSGYAVVETAEWAAILYVLDHLFFAFAIAIKTYFQKIADPRDIAATAGVSFTINHIAAVGIPAAFGFIWLGNPGLVFLLGAGMAGVSLLLALNVPLGPKPGREVLMGRTRDMAPVHPAE